MFKDISESTMLKTHSQNAALTCPISSRTCQSQLPSTAKSDDRKACSGVLKSSRSCPRKRIPLTWKGCTGWYEFSQWLPLAIDRLVPSLFHALQMDMLSRWLEGMQRHKLSPTWAWSLHHELIGWHESEPLHNPSIHETEWRKKSPPWNAKC